MSEISIKKSKADPKFIKHAVMIVIACFFSQYMLSCLPSDSVNVFQNYFHATYGWSLTSITAPITIAALVSIPLTFVVGTVLLKWGPRIPMAASLIILAICQVIVGFSSSLAVLSIALFLTKFFALVLQLCTYSYTVRWFSSWRGRILGIITIASPINSATSVALLTKGTQYLGFSTTYTILGIVVLALGIYAALVGVNNPEQLGLYADGKPEPISSEDSDFSEVKAKWTTKKIFATKETWMLIISFGMLAFMINGIMPNFILRMASVGVDINTSLILLSAAALLGIPISYLFGWLDDKFGTSNASTVLGITFLITMICLLLGSADNMLVLFIGVVGIASIIGGTPNLAPSNTAWVFGRKAFEHVNRQTMTIMNIIPAFALTFMSMIFDHTGSFNLAYKIMIGMAIIATVIIFFIKTTYDPENPKAAKI